MDTLQLALALDENMKRNMSLMQQFDASSIRHHKLKKRNRLRQTNYPKRIVTEERWRHFFNNDPSINFIAKDFFIDATGPEDEKLNFLGNSILILSNTPPQYGENNLNTLISFFNLCLKLENTIIAVWDWDNHHHLHISSVLSASADLYFPSHKAQNLELNLLCDCFRRLPLSSHQWDDRFMAKHIHEVINHNRRNDIAGYYVRYEMFGRRNEHIQLLNAKLKNVKFVETTRYWERSLYDRLIEWLEFKCQWIIPTLNDISTRVFDSLITGNVVIIPERFRFDESLSELHEDDCVYYTDQDILDPSEVCRQALEKFDRWGELGILRRVNFGLDNNLDKRIFEMRRIIREDFFMDHKEWR